MNKAAVAELVANTETPQIRAGDTHRFIDIWIVTVGKRLFCRQYDFRANSWYDAFLAEPSGAIRCGDTVIPIMARVPKDLDAIQEDINQAYRDKYVARFTDNADYGREMTGEKFWVGTMELVPQ